MALSDFSIRRPVFSWMLMSGAILFGLMSFKNLGVSQLPDVDFPVVNVSLRLEGAAPEVMETDVVDQVEGSLLTINGISTMSSNSRNSVANITVEFDLSKDIDTAMQEVQNKITQVQNRLPKDLEPPVISKVNPEDQPIMWLAVTADSWSRRDLMAFVRDVVKDRFTTVEGVGDVILGGYVDPNLRVWLNTERLRGLDITANDVISTIQDQHSEVPAGYLETPREESNVRTMGEAKTEAEFGKLVVNKRGGAPREVNIRLDQVARIEDGLADVRQISRANGKPAVGLGIRKQRGTNAVAVAEAVKARMAEMSKTLPEGIQIFTRFDSTKFIKNSIATLNHELIMAAILTGIVCWFFLGSLSSTINILLAIPFSVVGAFTALYFFGFTLNTFTLLALTLCIGIVVDDAIMMLENIVRHYEMGKSRIRAAFDGAREISGAATVTTIAIVAIFVPVVFMEGVIGKFFLQFGIALSTAVLLSLLEALTLTPSRCSQLLSVGKRTDWLGSRIERGLDGLTSAYKSCIPFLLRNRWKIVILSVAVFVGSLGLITILKKEFIPPQDQSVFIVRVQTPVGSSIEFTDGKMAELEKFLAGQPVVDGWYMSVGGFSGGEVNSGFLFITLKDKKNRPINPATGRRWTQGEFMNLCRTEMNKVKDARAIIQDLSSRGFSGSSRGFQVEFTLVGPEWSKLGELTESIMKELNDSGVAADVDTDYKIGMPEVHVFPERDKAAARGVSTSAIGQTVGALIGGVVAGRYTNGARRYDIRVRLEADERSRADQIEKLFVRNNYGEIIPLSQVVRVEKKPVLQNVTRRDRQRAISIFANAKAPATQDQVMAIINNKIMKTLPAGYRIIFSGNAQASKEAFMSLMLALGLGIAVAYMVMASQFNSFIHPVTILSALPFSITGAFIALLLTGQSLNMYSMIGLLLLMGITKKNSILLVEFTNQMREHKPDLKVNDALIEACPVRLRPILMTSVATISAAVPSALGLGEGSEVTRPMAASIIGGMTLSTILTMFVVPCLYSLFSKLEKSTDFEAQVAAAEREEVPLVGQH